MKELARAESSRRPATPHRPFFSRSGPPAFFPGPRDQPKQPLIQRQVESPAPLARVSEADIRGFIEEIIRFWGGSREHFRLTRVTQELLARLLDTWLGMMNNGWRLIDERLDGDAALLSRLKVSYRDTISALVRKASRDLGVAELELYRQHNTRIAWWLRRDLAPRTDIVFILGGGDAFYTSATHYFQFVGAQIVTTLGRGGRAQLDLLVRPQDAQRRGWTDIRETPRQTGADGLTTITFSYRAGGQQFRGATIVGLLPRLSGQRDIRALLSRQDDLMAMTRPLEEGGNLTADDFFWTLARARNPGAATFDYQFTGSRTMLRIQRDLVEPDPSRPGRTRRVRPDISETSQYGRELPANY